MKTDGLMTARRIAHGRRSWRTWLSLAALALACCTGCEEDPFLASVAGHDFGDMDPSLCAAMGDSITIGYGDAGAPWPARLSAMLGSRVDNYGVGGMTSDGGVAMVDGVLSTRPGFVMIYYGANDAIHGRSADSLKNSLAEMVNRVTAANAIALVANLTPMTDGHGAFASAVDAMNVAISDLCNETDTPLVDLADEFGSGDGLLQPDGLHPNSDGQEAIAEVFYRHLRHAVQ
ncbi:MAG: GDSL-type esterase/lipase family protein [Kiritimatiellae bacterium]|nr:GDSL-type esterase/lipase family protein [Kiritimatiellia bacterium]